MARKRKPITRKAFVISVIRRATFKWPPRGEAIEKARISRGLYRCASCQGEFKNGEYQVDHKVPIVSVKDGWTNMDDFINRALPDVDGWQILCITCHNIKTSIEDGLRDKNRLKRKNKDET